MEHEGLRLLAEHRKSGDRQFLVEHAGFGRAGFTEHHARLANGIGHDLVVARQRAQLLAGRLIEIAECVGGDFRIEPVRLGEHGVEGDHDRAEPCQVGDDVGDPRARPGPLPELGSARLFSSISTMVTGRMVFTRGSKSWKLSQVRIRISSIGCGSQTRKRGKADQQHKADQPGIPEAPREPPPQCPQSLHGNRFGLARDARQNRNTASTPMRAPLP